MIVLLPEGMHRRSDIFIDPRFDAEYERNPLVLVDVGARGGLKRNWAVARRHLRVIGFEPDTVEFRRLQQTLGTGPHADILFDVALHNRRGTIRLNIARDRGLSSIFEPDRSFVDSFPQSERFDTIDVAEIEADTLDAVLGSQGISDVDFIKVDTQGSELMVLQGASRLMESSIVGVEVEGEFSPIYRGQPLFADVDAFLRGLGFMLFDLRPVYWKRAAGWDLGGPWGQIVWADALYLKSPATIRSTIEQSAPEARRSKALRAVSVALLYGYRDYALEIARTGGGVLTADDRSVIEAAIRRPSRPRNPLRAFPGRRLAAGVFRRLWTALRDRRYGWSVSGGRFGNPE